jgi:hypothetical protein
VVRFGSTSFIPVPSVVATFLLAPLAPPALAQNADVYPELTLTGAMTSQDAARPTIPEKPRDDLQVPQKDVFQAKTVEVKAGELKEEAPVGEYDQPLWTTFRRFPRTRIYLQTPPGGAQFEQWVQFRNPRESKDAETRLSQEFEFGLGHRLQLDLYLNELHVRSGKDSSYDWSGYSTELRYALGDWDEIWGNPTLYLEYTFNDEIHDGTDAIEGKALFGGEITTGWHWGVNFSHERSIGSADAAIYENTYTGSVSKTIVDSLLSLGATSEVTYFSEPEAGAPRERGVEVYLGPSLQVIPHPRAAISLEPLWGLTGKSLHTKVFVIFSWHF